MLAGHAVLICIGGLRFEGCWVLPSLFRRFFFRTCCGNGPGGGKDDAEGNRSSNFHAHILSPNFDT
ncbi:MAG: hypothetical protein ACPIOQ_04900 [Promethearchaeia archaeon]